MGNTLYAGVGRTVITPALGTPLAGYPDPLGNRKAESIRDPLHATVLSFEYGDLQAAVVSLDSTVIDDRYVAAIRKVANQRTGIPEAHILVCAIQTHSAPRTQHVWGWSECDVDYCEQVLVPGAVEAVAAASSNRVPVRIGVGLIESHVAVNRRKVRDDHSVGLRHNTWGTIDPNMTVLRFESKEGTLANVVHYGAHPTVFNSKSKVVSRDWPGIMIDRMESLTGATTLFINGAVGDIAPRTNSMSAVGDGESALWEAGGRAAMDSMAVWRSIKDFR